EKAVPGARFKRFVLFKHVCVALLPRRPQGRACPLAVASYPSIDAIRAFQRQPKVLLSFPSLGSFGEEPFREGRLLLGVEGTDSGEPHEDPESRPPSGNATASSYHCDAVHRITPKSGEWHRKLGRARRPQRNRRPVLGSNWNAVQLGLITQLRAARI